MTNEGINIFLGPPFSGKETQTSVLTAEFGLPVLSMGQLIRNADRDPNRQNDPIVAAHKKYTENGLHVPIDIKFPFLESEMNARPNGFILDNFPASKEDLDRFNQYLKEHELKVNKVFYLKISQEEMFRRFEEEKKSNPEGRGRKDDTPETLATRRAIQGADLIPVLDYYRSTGQLVEINGEQPVSVVSQEIRANL